MHTEKVLMRY